MRVSSCLEDSRSHQNWLFFLLAWRSRISSFHSCLLIARRMFVESSIKFVIRTNASRLRRSHKIIAPALCASAARRSLPTATCTSRVVNSGAVVLIRAGENVRASREIFFLSFIHSKDGMSMFFGDISSFIRRGDSNPAGGFRPMMRSEISTWRWNRESRFRESPSGVDPSSVVIKGI